MVDVNAPRDVQVRFVAFFFVFGNFAGILAVYLPPYIKSLGFSATELGQLQAIPPFLTCFVPLIWAQLADRFGIRLLLVRLLLLGMVIVFTAFHFAGSGAAIAAALLATAVFRSGVLPIADALALSNLSSTQYVAISITNGLSWVVSTTLFAFFLADAPPSEQWAVRAIHVLMVLAAVSSLFLVAKAQPTSQRPKLADGLALLRDRRILRFLIAIMIYWSSMGAFDNLLALHTGAMGYGASAAGYAYSVSIGAEIVVMMFAPKLGFDLVGMPTNDPPRAHRLMLVVMSATAGRWFLSAVAPNMPLFLVAQTLHGLSFGAFILLAAGTMRKLVPEGLRATGQALLFSACAGVGSMLGALIAGAVADAGGTARAFQVAGGIALLACGFFAATARVGQASEAR